MNFKTTLALLALLVVVAGFFYFQRDWTTGRDVEQNTATGDGLPLFTADELSTESVDRIVITRGDQRRDYRREGDQWFEQVGPNQIEVNGWSARGLIDDMAGLHYREKFTKPSDGLPDPATLDFDPPRATVALSGTVNGRNFSKSVSLGRPSIGGRGYLFTGALGDESHGGPFTAYLVNDDLHDAVLTRDLKELRKRALSGPTSGAVQSLVLERGDQRVAMQKNDGRWVFVGDRAGRADSAAAGALANALQNTFVEKWVDDDPSDLAIYGLTNPHVRLTLTASAPADDQADNASASATQTYQLLLGSRTELDGESRFGMLLEGDQKSAPVFSVGAAYSEKLQVSVADLRDKAISLLQPSEVRSVRITGQVDMGFDKTPDGWVFSDETDPGYPADSGVVSAVIEKITQATGEPQPIDASESREKLAEVTLATITSGEPEVLRFEMVDGERIQVVRNDEPVGYVVDEVLYSNAMSPKLTFRAKTLDVVGGATRVSISPANSEGAAFTFTCTDPASNTWTLNEHDEFEDAAFQDLLGMLAPLTVESWVVGPTRPRADPLVLVAEAVGGAMRRELRVDPQTRLASLSGVDAQFIVSDALVQALQAEYRERTVIPIAADAIQKVTLNESTEDEFVLIRDGQSWASEGGAPVNSEAVAALVDQLAGLEVVRYSDRPLSELGTPQRTLKVRTADNSYYVVKLFKGTTLSAISNGITFGQPRPPCVIELDDATLDKLRAPLRAEAE